MSGEALAKPEALVAAIIAASGRVVAERVRAVSVEKRPKLGGPRFIGGETILDF